MLTDEARGYLSAGTPEAQVFAAVPPEGIALPDLKAKLPAEVSDVGLKQAMAARWLATEKACEPGAPPRVVRKVESAVDAARDVLAAVEAGQPVDKAAAELLQKKRKLMRLEAWKTYALSRGPKFAAERKRQATDLTADMIAK